jgi:hypothetical protein
MRRALLINGIKGVISAGQAVEGKVMKKTRLSQKYAIGRKDAGSAVPTSRDSNGAEGSEW